MKILNQTPISLSEVKSHVSDFEDRKQLEDYMKTFCKLDKKKADALIKDIENLNNPKFRLKDIVKVADFLPKTPEEANKIFTDVSLSEEEANAIVEIVKKY